MKNLKTLREARGLTRKQLALLMMCGEKTIASWESGKSYPEYYEMPRLTEVLNATHAALFGNEDEPTESDVVVTLRTSHAS